MSKSLACTFLELCSQRKDDSACISISQDFRLCVRNSWGPVNTEHRAPRKYKSKNGTHCCTAGCSHRTHAVNMKGFPANLLLHPVWTEPGTMDEVNTRLLHCSDAKYPADTVILHSKLGRGPSTPSVSSFVLKLETYLKVAKIPYKVLWSPLTVQNTNVNNSAVHVLYHSRKNRLTKQLFLCQGKRFVGESVICTQRTRSHEFTGLFIVICFRLHSTVQHRRRGKYPG